MNLETDDDIHRARLVWLGPPGWTLPIHLPYAQWGVGTVLTIVFTTIMFLIAGDLSWVGLAIALGIGTTWLIWRYVDPDKNARAVMRAAALDARKVREPANTRLPRLDASNITIRAQITTTHPLHELTKG
jgi:hypothetical protein